MFEVVHSEYNEQGVADLSSALQMTREKGISVAKNAIMPRLLEHNSTISGLGLGVIEMDYVGAGHLTNNNVLVRTLRVSSARANIRGILFGLETEIGRHTRGELPDWKPTVSPFGARIVSMHGRSIFYPHTDYYQGLVAAVQMGISGGNKVMQLPDYSEEIPLSTGDVILFACDGFGVNPRVEHGFTFDGIYAVSMTLGQDPSYICPGGIPPAPPNE